VNSPQTSNSSARIYAIAIIGSFLIMAGLVSVMRYYTRQLEVGSARVTERRKAAADLSQSTSAELRNYGILDPAKGLVRLPVQHSMEVVLNEWKNPAAGRSNLLARLKQANPPPPPPAPEKPSPFE
jgi:hypothetical protein